MKARDWTAPFTGGARKLCRAACCLFVLAAALNLHAQAVYTSSDLGQPVPGVPTHVTGINDSGMIIGYCQSLYDLSSEAFVWTNGSFTLLTNLGGNDTVAYGINNLGEVVGSYDDTNNEVDWSPFPVGQPRAFFWTNGVMADLNIGVPGASNIAYGINDSGMVVGVDSTNGGFSWQDGVETFLPPLAGGNLSQPSAINNDSVIAGTSFDLTSVTNVIDNANEVLTYDINPFEDGSGPWWSAAPGYYFGFVADTWYAFTGYPSYFGAGVISNFFLKAVADTNENGDFPIALQPDGSPFGYYSGLDFYEYYATGDGDFLIPAMEKLYYDKTGDIQPFLATSVQLAQALSNIPRNPLTTLVTVETNEPWIPWGFQDSVLKEGDDLMGSLLYYQAAQAMTALYTAAGDTAHAAFYACQASGISNNLSVLWDANDGMFYAATIQDNQIDIFGSAFAVYLGAVPPAQCTAISTYLVTNFTNIEYQGYVRQSPSDWLMSYSGQGTYDSGLWSIANEWIATALQITSPTTAVQLITDYSQNPDPTKEYYGVIVDDGDGNTENLASPMGSLAFVTKNPDLFDTSVAVLWSNGVASDLHLGGIYSAATAVNDRVTVAGRTNQGIVLVTNGVVLPCARAPALAGVGAFVGDNGLNNQFPLALLCPQLNPTFQAEAINDSGQIAGVISNGDIVLLTPTTVPVPPVVGIGVNSSKVPTLAISNGLGFNWRIQFRNTLDPSNSWQHLATLAITNQPQTYSDSTGAGQPSRFYRLLQAP